MAYKDDTNAQVILTIGAVSGILVIVLVIGLQAWFLSEEHSEIEAKYGSTVNVQLVELREKQQAKIREYRWVDKEKGIAAIPVEQAMKVLIENQGKLPSTRPN